MLKLNRIMDEEWDYLIILDACRYDYFESLREKYFDGELEKRISLGSNTFEWCVETFKGYYPDVIYVSGNPYINSKVEIRGFNASRHFYKVFDVWDFGWDYELGTVPPENINKTTLNLIRKYPQKRFIIHYLQPHAPYISKSFKAIGFPNPDPQSMRFLAGIKGYHKSRFEEKINRLSKLLVKVGIIKDDWILREWLGLPPASPMDAVRRKYGLEGLRKAYRENLETVLEHAARLCSELLHFKSPVQVVITSDHGELLGEGGRYGHKYRDRYTLEVPWFKVKKVKELD